MSTNHTSNYSLCQWVPKDKVLRVDFNEDNAKIDTALNALSSRTAVLEGKATSLEGNAFTIQNPQVVVGTYTGNGAETRTFNLGFRPKAVLVLSRDMDMSSDAYHSCGLAADGFISTAVGITSSGFEVYDINNGGVTWDRTNRNGDKFVYFAFK